MKKTLLAISTVAMLATSTAVVTPGHEADAATKWKAPSANRVASVARGIAANRVYQYGANNGYAVDCSAFAQQVMRALGKNVPRTTYGQMSAGYRVSNPKAGDLVFFNGGTHVGVYIGNGQMVDALNPSEGVRQRSVYYIDGSITGYYRY